MAPRSTLRHLASIVALPGVVTVLVPGTLWLATRRWPLPALALWGRLALVAAGAACLVAGLGLMVATIRLFARIGRGTLAPWDPTRHLVVEGPFRHVRNPMISGVMAVLLGEALALVSPAILGWFAFVVLANVIYIPLSEERGLVKRFGDEYRAYRRHVPRWIPRRTPWTPGDDGAPEA